MDTHNLTAKDRKKLHTWLRALIQLLYFLFIPSVYTAAFAGVKYIFTQIGAGEKIAMTSFVTVLCLPDADMDFEAYNLFAQVTIQDDKIIKIDNVYGDGGSGNDSYINKAVNGTSSKTGVVKQIIDKGNLDGIDAVSRATCTSQAIIDACQQALNNAKRQ